MTEQTSLKLVSTALSTAQSFSESNESIKKALTLILSSYFASKTILPVAINNKITDLENYVAAVDKNAIVASLDSHADNVYLFSESARKAKKVKGTFRFLFYLHLSLYSTIFLFNSIK